MNTLQTIKHHILSQFSFFMMVPALLWQIFFVFSPLCIIVMVSFLNSDLSPFFPLSFTLSHYQNLFDNVHFKIIGYSLLLAWTTASSCLLIGYPIAYFLALKAKRIKNILLFFLIIPFWSNLLILIYAWFFILDKDGLLNYALMHLGIINEPIMLLNSIYGVALVMMYCYLPFMIMPIFSSLEKIDITLIESSFDLGATVRQTFFHIIVPLSFSGIRTGYFLVFVVAFGEFVIPLLMGGDKYMFVGNAISHYILTASNNSAGAAFTCLSGVILLAVIVVLHWILKRLFIGQRYIHD